jgi:hypothetical protein
MRFSIKPGKVTCAGLVAIMMVLPSSIWKGGSARASVRVTVASESKKTP